MIVGILYVCMHARARVYMYVCVWGGACLSGRKCVWTFLFSYMIVICKKVRAVQMHKIMKHQTMASSQ